MKKILTLLALFIATATFAQPPGDKREKKEDRAERIKAHKIAFISTELSLTPDEAEKFWPVYNEMEAEAEVIGKERRQTLKKLKEFDALDEDEAYSLTEKLFELEAKENTLRKKYLGKFVGVVGKKKAARVFFAEEKFKRELLRKLKEKNQKQKQHKGAGNGGPPRDH